MMVVVDEGYLMTHEGYVEAYEFSLGCPEIGVTFESCHLDLFFGGEPDFTGFPIYFCPGRN